MADHQASEQMLGYLYQVRYALNLLLKNDDEQAQVCIEKFDDISFNDDHDVTKELIQLKHHTKHYGDLTDSSTDIWRTLKVWIDEIKKTPELLHTTKFTIITTASAPNGTAAYYLKDTTNRNFSEAYEILKRVSQSSKNKTHVSYYKAFEILDESMAKELLKNTFVVDGSNNIIDVENELKREIRYSCLPIYQDLIYERLEGWWFKKSIEALCSDVPVYASQSQVRSYIVSLSNQYTVDNLPIDIDDFDDDELEKMLIDNKIFYEQLKLIGIKNGRLKIALRDYYRAFKQRSNWVRNDLLYVNELEDYEKKLIDEWQHCFYAMQDELEEYGDEFEENIKVRNGKELFSQIEQKDIRIRSKCSDAFVMRGSYHILSNQLKVGWHIDFYERLKLLLE
ncbi:ABC-three component system protein [Clostridium butyricum]|uniref:ABC-three component system protein n=1 Tax=Clostridium butyricum TaxID=1492 RepID=UPI00374E5805